MKTDPLPGQLKQILRDGTKQSDRFMPALDPDYVKVDERSVRDLLAFAEKYSHELKYYNARNEEEGDWGGFVGDLDLDDLDKTGAYLDEAVAYLKEPEKFRPERASQFSRPHFALFLVFLQLLDRARKELNFFTRRHLDFYYREVLRMTHRPAVPDRVHVLIDLAADTDELLVPAGTALSAGTDSLGQNLVYLTNREIVVNQAQVDRVSSLYVDKKRTGIKEAREQHHRPGEEALAFLRMLEVALGEPNPGDPLPEYPFEPASNKAVDYDLLKQLHDLVDFVKNERDGLAMPFHEFRDLMRLRRRRENEDKEWEEINRILEEAGKARDRNFQLSDPKDFQTNLRSALGDPPDFDRLYDGLPEVKSIEQAYEQRFRPDVRRFIQDKLHLPEAKFEGMMQIKLRIDAEWREINRLLEVAAKRKDPSYQLSLPAGASRKFEEHLQKALSPQFSKFHGIDGIEKFHKAFVTVEVFFFLTAEDFSFIMTVSEKKRSSSEWEWEWEAVYRKLADAHAEKVYARRRDTLADVRRLAEDQRMNGVEAMIGFALGERLSSTGGGSMLEKLKPFVPNETDYTYLEKISADNAAETDWDRAYRILEIAQRNRENFKKPIPWKEDWIGLWPMKDATAARVQSSLQHDQAMGRWKTFGQGGAAAGEKSSSGFGWALSSPLLVLSQGTRTITLTLAFSSEKFDVEKIRNLLDPSNKSTRASFNPFQIQVSTAKGWLEPTTSGIEWNLGMGSYPESSAADDANRAPLKALRVTLSFSEKEPPLTSANREVHGIDSSWPVVRLMLKPAWQENYRQTGKGRYVTHYEPFRHLVLLRIHLKVEVKGFSNFQIQNDEGPLDAKKPFEPFGTNPHAGSRFYLAHPEIVGKKLDKLSFQIEWMAPPTNLKVHYQNYPDEAIKDNASFRAGISLIDRGVLIPFSDATRLHDPDAQKLRLFEPNDAQMLREIQLSPPVYERDTNIVVFDDLREWSRCILWQLHAPDFQHHAYPTVAMRKSVEMAAALVTEPSKVKAEAFQVNPPYTPKVTRLTLGYASTVGIILDSGKTASANEQVFHVQPFGYNIVGSEAGRPGCKFLPQYDFDGELYIGLRNVRPPQNLALLVQMAEGSADPDLAPEPVHWSYLSGNCWLSLQQGNLLLDATRGLINSGIIEFALPPAETNTLLPPSLYWIRVAIPTRSNSVCDTIGIHAQAVAATFENRNNALDHLSRPLPAKRITELATREPEIVGVRQPYTSFAGDGEESDEQFYVRVSERLRHKQRAVTLWDYEHLILERFPQIYKVKCLTADPIANPDDPGRVEIVVVPDIRKSVPFDPFEPKAAAALIADIEAFLKDKTSPFAAVKVRNAHYIPVKLRLVVRFHRGKDEGSYKKRLNEELNRFLSPWAYEEGANLIFGGKIYANSIVNFVDQRPYVDFVAALSFFISEDGKTFHPVRVPESEGYHVAAKRPDGVLVAAGEHEIDLISEAGYEAEEFIGINYMKIELDFTVA
jgi:hypothetical protein